MGRAGPAESEGQVGLVGLVGLVGKSSSPTRPTRPFCASEDFGFESPELRALLPCLQRQPGLVTCLREEGRSVPFPFGRDLRQEKAALPASFDDESVPADFDLLRTGDRLERAKQRELDVE